MCLLRLIRPAMFGVTFNLVTRVGLTVIFGVLKDGSLINILASNNCFIYRNVFQNGANALSTMVFKNTVFCQKNSKFCVVWTIRFCLNFTSMWYKYFCTFWYICGTNVFCLFFVCLFFFFFFFLFFFFFFFFFSFFFLGNVWRDFKLPILALATVTRKSLTTHNWHKLKKEYS